MVVVTLNGCFDVLHSGHLDLFDYAKNKGDFVIILLNSDKSIKKLKGKNRPINNEKDRKRMLESLVQIDAVFLFNTEDELHSMLNKIQPDFHIKSKGAKKKLVKLEEISIKPNGKLIYFKPKNLKSTTKILKKVFE